MIFSEFDAFTSLVEKASKIYKTAKNKTDQSNDTISSRFMNLFEAHGVHRNQIPRVFGHGITISSVQSDTSLLPHLTEQTLEDACLLFNIHREWLDGADKQVYPTYDFYKDPNAFKEFIENLTSNINGVLLTPKEKNTAQESLLLLQEVIGHIEDKPFYRYYLINNWYYSYWKSRAYLAACIAHCWARKIHVHGLFLLSKTIEKISCGENLMPMGKDGIYYFNGKKWYPEDMALNPDVFLKGVDPEIDKFGLKAGLQLWLKLESKGHMHTGLENDDTRKNFMRELEKFS